MCKKVSDCGGTNVFVAWCMLSIGMLEYHVSHVHECSGCGALSDVGSRRAASTCSRYVVCVYGTLACEELYMGR